MTTLDSYAESAELSDVSLLKVDVEGHELEVLRGGARLLEGPRAPVISFEVNEECLRDRGIGAPAIGDFLSEMGYVETWEIDDWGNARPVESPLPSRNGNYLTSKPARSERLRRALRRPLRS